MQGAVIESFKEKSVETRPLPETILEALRIETRALLDERAAQDPLFARVLESQRRFSDAYARWQRLAYPAPPERVENDKEAGIE